MPNRIIKESVCSSESVDKLSWMEEAFFYRLIVNCDDFGRFDARPQILKARLFPLKSVTENQISACLKKLSDVGIVFLYDYDEKPYIQLLSWEQHQRVRTRRSKYPPDDIQSIQELIAQFGNAKEAPAEPKEKPEKPKDESPTVIGLLLNTGAIYGVTEEQVGKWTGLYPAVDVMQSLRNMSGWLEANPKKRKTSSGILKFINAWLSKEQNQGPKGYATAARQVQNDADYNHASAFGEGC